MKFRRLSVLCLSLAIVLGPASALLPASNAQTGHASAASTTFQAGHIIDDNVFTNSNALTASQIQTFLNDMVGTCYAPGAKSTSPENGACINQYVENTSTLQNNFTSPNATITGGISAAQIIYNAAQQYSINPEVILATLEKEQGLVTDNWPWYSEYQNAMGYACPDSSGCGTTYADFYKQINGAAWQFRQYLNNPGTYNYWIGSNTINYAPGCSGSTVNIVNAATAALYIYTPYQPDSTVLANTNSVGSSSGPGPSVSASDSCASYGNRNFWWYFNSWFGPSLDTNVSLAEETGGTTVYVLYDGQKQGIPSGDVLNAWGLEGLPITMLDASVFNAIPTASTVLSRYATSTTTNQNYFADNGNVYYVSSADASAWGNFPGQPLSKVSSTLTNFANYQGELKPFAAVSGGSTDYVVDNGVLHTFSNNTIYNLWAGSVTPVQLSSSYFSTMSVASGSISSPEFSYNGADYLLSDGTAFGLSNISGVFSGSGWSIQAISQGLASSFTSGGNLHYMVTAPSASTIYLLDSGGVKRGIPDSQTYSAFQADSSGDTTLISNDLLNFLSTGSPISSNIVNLGGSYYVVNRGLQAIPSYLSSAYNASSTGITLSSVYQSVFPTLGVATAFVTQPNSTSGTYFLDAGQKLPFNNSTTYDLFAGPNTYTTGLTSDALSNFAQGSTMQNYVTNGSTNYLLDRGQAYTVSSASLASAWNLSTPLSISSASTGNFSVAGALTQYAQIPNGQFCFVDTAAYCAQQAPLLTVWGFGSNGPIVKPSQELLNTQNLGNNQLSPFVTGLPGQTYGGTVYVMAGGRLIGIPTYSDAVNLGINRYPLLKLDNFSLNNLMSNQIWQGYLATDSSNATWILDGGVKRALPSQYQSPWLTNTTATALGSDFLSLLPTGPTISDAIIAPGNPTLYGLKNGEVYGIPSGAVYSASGLGPYVSVTTNLLISIPGGGIWNQ